MASVKICSAANCDKRTWGGLYCSMHAARLRRGGSLEPRQPTKPIEELLGANTFGLWSVLGEGEPYERPLKSGKRDPAGRQRTAHCRCICGVERDIPAHILKRAMSRHCGCLVPAMTILQKTTHGMSDSPEYRSWAHMKERCSNPNCADFPDYGGRGIAVCEKWQTFEPFLADMGRRPSETHSIEREDVNGNYDAANCRWATPREQAGNKRTTFWVEMDGERVALREACRRLGLGRDRYKVVHQRMFRRGLSFEEATRF